jgi:hypothetical protein
VALGVDAATHRKLVIRAMNRTEVSNAQQACMGPRSGCWAQAASRTANLYMMRVAMTAQSCRCASHLLPVPIAPSTASDSPQAHTHACLPAACCAPHKGKRAQDTTRQMSAVPRSGTAIMARTGPRRAPRPRPRAQAHRSREHPEAQAARCPTSGLSA